jgi:hypothetical protein
MYRADTWAEADISTLTAEEVLFSRGIGGNAKRDGKKKQRKGESEGKYFRRQINKQQNVLRTNEDRTLKMVLNVKVMGIASKREAEIKVGTKGKQQLS